MNLTTISDRQLLQNTRRLAEVERDVLSKVIRHLREIERRRLYSELGYKSLFEYAMGELKYSESQAYRRISALKLIKELPEVESKVSSGKLSLSNITEAQSFFRRKDKAEGAKVMSKSEKLDVLETLEDKSTREGKNELFKLDESAARPKERERRVSESCSEVRFVLDDGLKEKLDEVRSLLGPKGAKMDYSELFEKMAGLSAGALKEKKFGKKRSRAAAQKEIEQEKSAERPVTEYVESLKKKRDGEKKFSASKKNLLKREDGEKKFSAPKKNGDARYISKATRHEVWLRDGGRCTNCGGRQNLNYDHIRPVAHGGESSVDNLRLLCFSCNQRAAVNVFGVSFMSEAVEKNALVGKRSPK